MFSVKLLLGLILALFNIIGLFFTTIAFYAVINIVQKPYSSSIYIMAAANLTIDLGHLMLSLFYLAPTIIFDTFFFEGDRDSPFVVGLGTVFLFFWYYGSIAQALVAFNRFIVLCFPAVDFFKAKTVLIMMLSLYPFVLVLSIISQYVLPCCNFSFNHQTVSYSYREIPGIFNYSNGYIDLWLNSISSGTCLLFYTIIVIYVHYKNRQLQNIISGAQQKQRRMKEYRYALQFLAVSIFYLFSWTFFRIYPLFMTANSSINWFGLIPIAVAINSTANAAIYLIYNKEVQGVLTSKMRRIVMTNVTVASVSSRNNL